jgi:hypothetical protein
VSSEHFRVSVPTRSYTDIIRSCALSLGQGFCLRVSYELEHELTCRLASVMLAPPCTGGTVLCWELPQRASTGEYPPTAQQSRAVLPRRPLSLFVTRLLEKNIPVGLSLPCRQPSAKIR